MNAPHSAIAQIIADQSSDKLFTPDQAAAYLGMSTQTLAIWRCTKRYPLPYIKVGRLVRYRKSGCDAFLESRTIGTMALS